MKKRITRITLSGQEFTIYAEPGEYKVEYEVFEEDDTDGPLIMGYVKWDGCSNWEFPSVELGMFHGCHRSNLTDFGELMAKCWDMTVDLCENADRDVFYENYE